MEGNINLATTDLKKYHSLTMQQKFALATRENNSIKQSYLAFMHFDNSQHNSTTLKGYVLEGNLKKLVSEFKIFQAKTQLKRYFRLDFNFAIFYVHEQKDSKQTKQYKFSSIKSVWIPQNSQEEDTIIKSKSKTFKYGFLVKLEQRDLYLYAESEVERTIWGNAFDYAIISTLEVQKIIKEADQYSKGLAS